MFAKLMINKIFIFLLLVTGVFSGGRAAEAQECLTNYEEIFEIKDTLQGSFSVWDAVVGKNEYNEEFSSGLRMENGHVVVAGTREYQKKAHIGPNLIGKSVMLAEIDLRGRTVWENFIRLEGLEKVHKILTQRNGYLVLASVVAKTKKRQAVLLFVDGKGALVTKKTIDKAGSSFEVRDIEKAWDGKGFMLAATASKPKEGVTYALLYALNSKGDVIWERSYRPGANNVFLSVRRSDERFYVLTGQIEDDRGRQSGWVMKVSDNGEILWQQQYSRGVGARIFASTDFPGQRMLVTGQIVPANEGLSAGWVMMLNRQNGETLWQRYYTSKFNSEARDVLVGNGDEIISVLMNSKPSDAKDRLIDNFSRILTINPRGVLFSRDDFLNAEGAAGQQLLEGRARQRIVVGRTQVSYDVPYKNMKTGEMEITKDRSSQGWVVSAPAPETYSDPCKAVEKNSSGDEQENAVQQGSSIFP